MDVKMNPEAKAKVLAALRSGDYQQGYGELHNAKANCFCVWGVLSDVSGAAEWVDSSMEGIKRYGHGGDICFPNPEVRNWAGIDTYTLLNINGVSDGLMEHNDAGRTFEELAAAIEEQL